MDRICPGRNFKRRRTVAMPARLIPLAGGPPIVIDKPIILVGRQPDCDAVLQTSTKVSRRHACVAHVNNRFLVRDLGSMNGVRVNGVRIHEQEIKPGDEVSIGDVYFVFRSEDANLKGTAPSTVGHKNGAKFDEPSSGVEAVPRPTVRSQDISMEFPVVIPDELGDDDVVPVGSEPGPAPVLHEDSDDIQLKD